MCKGIASCAIFTSAAECMKALVLNTIFQTACWEHATEKSTKSELVFWLKGKDYVAHGWMKECYLVTTTELDWELDSNLKPNINI